MTSRDGYAMEACDLSHSKGGGHEIIWQSDGIYVLGLMMDYLHPGHNIDSEYYASLIKWLRGEIEEKTWESCQNLLSFLETMHLLWHKMTFAMAAFHYSKLEIIPHPPYPLDLFPSFHSWNEHSLIR